MIRVLITAVLSIYTWNKIKRWLKELGKKEEVKVSNEEVKVSNEGVKEKYEQMNYDELYKEYKKFEPYIEEEDRQIKIMSLLEDDDIVKLNKEKEELKEKIKDCLNENDIDEVNNLAKELKKIEKKIISIEKAREKEEKEERKSDEDKKTLARTLGNIVGEFKKGIAEVRS